MKHNAAALPDKALKTPRVKLGSCSFGAEDIIFLSVRFCCILTLFHVFKRTVADLSYYFLYADTDADCSGKIILAFNNEICYNLLGSMTGKQLQTFRLYAVYYGIHCMDKG